MDEPKQRGARVSAKIPGHDRSDWERTLMGRWQCLDCLRSRMWNELEEVR